MRSGIVTVIICYVLANTLDFHTALQLLSNVIWSVCFVLKIRFHIEVDMNINWFSDKHIDMKHWLEITGRIFYVGDSLMMYFKYWTTKAEQVLISY
jgi:hypothetical protein